MARYIDADALIDYIRQNVMTSSIDSAECKEFMIDHIGMEWFAPTADVVPRAEVEKMFGEIEGLIDKHYNKHIFGNNDLEDEEKEAVMNFSDDVTYDIDELKKKYIGDKR